MSALQSFNHNRSFISFQDLFKVMAFVTSVHVNPLVFALASLALLSMVRSAAISMSVSQFSNLVELYSLKTDISSSNEFMKFDCFCQVHKVSVYYCITSPRGSAGAGGCGWWIAIKRFWSSCHMQSRVSLNLSWLLYAGSSGCLTASGSPRETVASELWVLSLLISVCSGSSVWISKPLSRGQPLPPWWVAIACILYVVQ